MIFLLRDHVAVYTVIHSFKKYLVSMCCIKGISPSLRKEIKTKTSSLIMKNFSSSKSSKLIDAKVT